MNASGSGYTAFVESIRTYILLWTTPSWSLSLLLESERGRLSFILAVLSTFFSRILLRQPSLLQQALQRELESRPPSSDGDSAISAHTLRLVDSGYWRATRAQQAHAHGTSGFHSAPIFPEDLVSRIATAQGVSPASSGASGDDSAERAYLLLQEALDRVLVSYAIVEEVVLRAETSFAVDGSDDARLLELWKLLRPEGKLKGLVSKQWQEIGFQSVMRGSSPPTDFRGLGILALDALLFFAREYGDRAVEVVDEAIDGGENWYPLALASIHMTAFTLEMGTSRDLQLALLRSLQTRPSPSPSSSPAPYSSLDGSPPTTSRTGSIPDTTPFLRIAASLLLLFHAHWLQAGYTVMQFEAVSRDFQRKTRPWIRRGVLDGRALGWARDAPVGDKKRE